MRGFFVLIMILCWLSYRQFLAQSLVLSSEPEDHIVEGLSLSRFLVKPNGLK